MSFSIYSVEAANMLATDATKLFFLDVTPDSLSATPVSLVTEIKLMLRSKESI